MEAHKEVVDRLRKQLREAIDAYELELLAKWEEWADFDIDSNSAAWVGEVPPQAFVTEDPRASECWGVNGKSVPVTTIYKGSRVTIGRATCHDDERITIVLHRGTPAYNLINGVSELASLSVQPGKITDPAYQPIEVEAMARHLQAQNNEGDTNAQSNDSE